MAKKTKSESELEWIHNASTGNDHLRILPNGRVLRLCGGGIYFAEYFGDWSLGSQVRGPYRESLETAIADLKRLARGSRKNS